MIKHLLLLIFIILLYAGNLNAQDNFEALKHSLQKATNDTVKCSIIDQLIEIAPDGEWQLYNQQLQQISVKNIRAATDKQLLKFYLRYYALSLHNQGIIFSEQANDDKSIEFFNRSILVSKSSGHLLEMAMSMQAIAQIDIRKGNNIKALYSLYDCLKIFEQEKDEIGIADVHLSIGDINFLQKDFKKAIEHHTISYDLYVKNKYEVALGTVCYKLGVDYFESKNYTKALDLLQRSIQLFESTGYGANSVAYLNIAQIFIYQEKYEKAISYVEKGLNTASSSANKLEIAHSYFLYSKLYTLQNDFKNAIAYAEKSLLVSQEIEHPAEIYAASKQLYDLYLKTNQSGKAQQMISVVADSKKNIDNQESKNALLEQKLKYEYEKKELISKSETEKQMSLLQAEVDKKNMMKNIWLIVSLGIIIMASIVAFFLVKHFKQKSLINEQKNNLLKQKLLVSQMNPHFIFNSLNAIQNYIFKQDSLKAGTYLNQFSELIRMILDYSRKDFISVDAEVKLLENYLQLQKLRFDNKLNYSILIDEQIDQESILIPPMLAQPFIENAIEHGVFHKITEGKVEVRLFFDKQNLVYEIEDNGIGMEDALKLKNKLKPTYESLATVITKERMSSLSEQFKEKIEIEIVDKKTLNSNNTGVKVKFVVPFKEV